MKSGDVLTIGAVVLGLGVLGALVFLAPEAEKDVGYRPIEITGSAITEAYNSSMNVVDVKTNVVRGGYVTVHVSLGGAPGQIIAQSGYLVAGTTMASMLTTEPVVVGKQYVALLHVDDGDSRFVMEDDLPVMSEGNVVRVDFTAEDKSTLEQTE